MSAWRSWLYSTWLLFPLEQQLEINCLQKKRILRLKDVMCIMMWQNKHSLVTVRQATELVHIRIVHDRKEGMHCSGKWFLTPDFHLLVKNRAANLSPASLMTLWNLSFDTQQNHYERRGSLQRVRTCHGALTHSILDLDAREILLISCPAWCGGLLRMITRWVQCRLSLDLGEATGRRKEKGLEQLKLPQTALKKDIAWWNSLSWNITFTFVLCSLYLHALERTQNPQSLQQRHVVVEGCAVILSNYCSYLHRHYGGLSLVRFYPRLSLNLHPELSFAV